MTKDELTALRQLCAQAQEARADLDNDFPVGAAMWFYSAATEDGNMRSSLVSGSSR